MGIPQVNAVQRTLVEAWGIVRETYVDPTFNNQGKLFVCAEFPNILSFCSITNAAARAFLKQKTLNMQIFTSG